MKEEAWKLQDDADTADGYGKCNMKVNGVTDVTKHLRWGANCKQPLNQREWYWKLATTEDGETFKEYKRVKENIRIKCKTTSTKARD